ARNQGVGFSYALDKPDDVIALVGAKIVTMKGDEIINDGALVVTRNRITAVGVRSAVQIPRGARVIDVSGKTIVPGFVDCHWHGGMGQEQLIPQASWIDYASLAFRVTTLHDPSHDSYEIFTHADIPRPRLLT